MERLAAFLKDTTFAIFGDIREVMAESCQTFHQSDEEMAQKGILCQNCYLLLEKIALNR